MPDEPLWIDDHDRYSRLRLIAWWDQDKLAKSRVLVVGAGAIGNEVLKNLALLGIGTVYVIDFDRVELTNLARSVLFRPSDQGRPKAEAAADAMRTLNPDTEVVPLLADVVHEVGLGLFQHVDVVIGCLDNREARLWVNRCCWKTTTPWVDGGIQEINGVVKVFVPPDSACYECAMTENDYRLINLRYSCPLLRREDLLSGKVPTAPTIASIIAGIQVQEALKLLHDMPVSAGQALVFNGVSNQFYSTQLPHRDDCLSHETYETPVELPLTNRATVSELFRAASPHMNGGELCLNLDRDFVANLECSPCNNLQPIVKPAYRVPLSDAVCPLCGRAARPDLQHIVEQVSQLANEQLCTLGVPPWDIVRVSSDGQERPFLLAADKPTDDHSNLVNHSGTRNPV